MQRLTSFDVTNRIIPDKDFKITPSPIAICTPLYDSMVFINHYLKTLTNIDYPDHLLSLYFTVQGNDGTYEYMKKGFIPWAKKHRKYKQIKIEKVEQDLGGQQVHVRNVVKCRKILVDWSKPNDVLFIDHDNFPSPNIITRLQQTMAHGGDIVAGVYIIYQPKDRGGPGKVGFTAFMIKDDKFWYPTLDKEGYEGGLGAFMVGKRLWCDAVAMGSTLIKRRVLDVVPFNIPIRKRTDDTEFCITAKKHGFKIIADFGMFVPHWGFRAKVLGIDNEMIEMKIYIDIEMATRRNRLTEIGIYPP
jgi:GT2 family glycosyltransferase